MNKIIPTIILSILLSLSAVAASAKPGPVVVLLSDDEAVYSQPVQAFRAEVKAPVRVFNLKGDVNRAETMMAEILALDPSLLFTLGAKASYVAKVWTRERPDLPVLFAMVLNWERYQLTEGQENVFGIAAGVEPGVQFAHMLMVAPSIKRIGVIYNDDLSAETVAAARAAATIFGVELVEQTVRRSSDIKRAYLEIADSIDGLLILADPVVYTLENVAWLQKRSMRDHLVCVGQSENVAKMGILMAIDPDVSNIGSQAASMARTVLSGRQSPKVMGVMPSLGTRLYLNLRTAHKIGLQPSLAAINMASEVFGDQ